jgi:hypothetical protein
MLTAPHVVALGALSTSANAMAGLGQMFLRASSLEASPEAVVESGTRAELEALVQAKVSYDFADPRWRSVEHLNDMRDNLEDKLAGLIVTVRI